MIATKRVYLSLGSNLGHRYALLQKAIFRLQERVGSVVELSPVYENPAVGFEGDDFLNACVGIDTVLSPQTLLKVVLQIEKELGRQRANCSGYQSRTLDIDLIFYEQETINTPTLVIPHPRMHERHFVLQPLADIAPKAYHPQLHQEVHSLLQQCEDQSDLNKFNASLYKNRLACFAQLKSIVIEGSIGVGKTTLAQKLAHDLNTTPVLERATANALLPKFYDDPAKYAFPLELSLLTERYQQLIEDKELRNTTALTVSDYDLSKSLIFAKITLPDETFALYLEVFEHLYREIPKPALYIYLSQDTEQLLKNIKTRGREYEQHISASYLTKIHTGYLEFIKQHLHQHHMIVDLRGMDFVNQPDDYEKIIEMLEDYVLGVQMNSV